MIKIELKLKIAIFFFAAKGQKSPGGLGLLP